MTNDNDDDYNNNNDDNVTATETQRKIVSTITQCDNHTLSPIFIKVSSHCNVFDNKVKISPRKIHHPKKNTPIFSSPASYSLSTVESFSFSIPTNFSSSFSLTQDENIEEWSNFFLFAFSLFPLVFNLFFEWGRWWFPWIGGWF